MSGIFSRIQMVCLAQTLFVLLHCQISYSEELDPCPTVEDCIKRIYEVVEPPESSRVEVSTKEWMVAKKLSVFGEEAVVQLMPLLKDSNEDVAQVAAAALRDVSHIDEKYLPEILDALDSDYELDWLPPALGRIESDAAAKEAVSRYMGSKSAPHNQEAYALRLSGKRAVPFIVQNATCGTRCSDKDVYELGTVLAEMDADARNEAAALIGGYLEMPSTSEDSVKRLIYLASFLKESGLTLEPKLLELRRGRPEFINVINAALIEMKSPHAADVFADSLRDHPDESILRDLAEMGSAGRGAGSVVVSLMDSENWSIRVMATLTVGAIGYHPAIPKLVELLNDQGNLKLNWAAAESLGQLRDASAIPPLEWIANHHWYPPIRDTAQQALKSIKAEKGGATRAENNRAFYSAISGLGVQLDACKKIEPKMVMEDKSIKLYESYAAANLKELEFPSVVLSYGAVGEDERRAEDSDGVIEVRHDNVVEYRQSIMQIPEVALKTEGGWLVGSDRGEWGGELAFLPDSEAPTILLNENVEDIYKFGDRYIVVTGLAHLGLNDGVIYELIKVGNYWSAKPWRALPGAPKTSWLVETGELLVNTYGGGSILVSRDGSMRMAECI